MKHIVRLNKQGQTIELTVDEGTMLLNCIQENESDFVAPCGGNGTCGKCQVEIPDVGKVLSCLHFVDKDMEVVLPDKLEMEILSSQYEFTKTIWPEPSPAFNLAPMPFGLAVDIGTTSMVFYLVNLVTGATVSVTTAINPQSKFGADVISRISYGETNPNGIESLQRALIKPINNALGSHFAEQGISAQDLVKVSVVGNTTMLHTLLGISALSIAHAPFTPVFTNTKRIKGSDLGLNIHPDAEVVLSPSLSAYVGADILSGLNSLDTSKLGETYLFVDIGTNGEMALVMPNKTLSCATAAGPAFEGANISCGMSATTGAIAKFAAGGYQVVGGAVPTGVCGSGLIDITAFLLKNKLLHEDGNLDQDYIIQQNGNDTELSITQQDIREIQLAKSAIMSGVKRLLAIAKITEADLDHVILAGGFGNYISIENAISIGLLPNIAINKYVQVGNTAGTGAVLALKSEKYLTETEELKDKMEYIELSTDEEFTMEFAMNMFFY